MNLLFVHQNFPGQFGRLSAHLAAAGHRVVAIGERDQLERREPVAGVTRVVYPRPRGAGARTHPYLQRLEGDVRRAQAVVRAAIRLREQGFSPEVIYGNPGWGELLFIRDVFPQAALIALYEFYFHPGEGDHGFDPATPATLDSTLRLRVRNATLALTIERADFLVSPTRWQASRVPRPHRNRLSVIHDGLDTARCRPDREARFIHTALPAALTCADEVLTYVSRNLEPYRGFDVFMRALPAILAARPRARVVIVGGDAVSYGSAPASGGNWREVLVREVGAHLDPERVHFTGRIPYADLVALFQVSTVHVYLTYPFVLSWSMLEAMACGALVVGSSTAPVTEMIEHGVTGLLTDFHRPERIAQDVIDALARAHDLAAVRAAARAQVVERFDFERVCAPAQTALIERAYTAGARRRAA